MSHINPVFFKKTLLPFIIPLLLVFNASANADTYIFSYRDFTPQMPSLQDGGNTHQAPIPGTGILTSTGRTMSQNCFENYQQANNISISQPSGSFTLDSNVSQQTIESSLGLSGSGQINFGQFGGDIRASFEKETRSNRYQLSFSYLQRYAGIATYNLPSSQSGLNILNNAARYLLSTNNTDGFLHVCGDGFTSQASAGATLLVTVNVSFNSAQDKSKFETSLNGNVKFASIAAQIASAAQTSNVSATLRLSAIQLGGDPSKLTNIFGQKSEGSYPSLSCAANNPNACQQMITNIITYAKGDFQTGFNPNNPQSYYFTNPSWLKWNYFLGNKVPSIDFNSSTTQRIHELLVQYHSLTTTQAFLSRYYSNAIAYTHGKAPAVLNGQIKTLQEKYDAVLALYKNGMLSYCFNEKANDTCPLFAQQINNAMSNLISDGTQHKLQALIDTIYLTSPKNTYRGILISLSTDNQIPSYKLFPFTPGNNGYFGQGVYALGNEVIRGKPNNIWYPLCQLNFYQDYEKYHAPYVVRRSTLPIKVGTDPTFIWEALYCPANGDYESQQGRMIARKGYDMAYVLGYARFYAPWSKMYSRDVYIIEDNADQSDPSAASWEDPIHITGYDTLAYNPL